MAAPDAHAAVVATGGGPLALICGGGALPYAVAEAAAARGRRVVLFALKGWADAARVADYPHHWIALGQFGRFTRLARSEGCRDVVFIGALVRPSITQVRLDFATLRELPRLIRMFRGGDDHLLSAIGRVLEDHGFRMLGAHEVAPDILAPEGPVGERMPRERDCVDIARGLAVLRAIGPFDIGQACVVGDNHVVAIEDAGGTDAMLARVAELRRIGRIAIPVGRGVLVKAPKPEQDRRFDLPTIGPDTVTGTVTAGLAGIAVLAGNTLVAEPQRLADLADREGLFVVGVRDDGAQA